MMRAYLAQVATAGALGVSVLLGVSGCDVPGLKSKSSSNTKTDSGGQVQLPERTVYQPGSPTPSPAAKVAQPSPSATKRTLTTTAPTMATSQTVQPTCPGRIREGSMNGLTVDIGATEATVSWPAAGDGTEKVLHYLLAAVPQELKRGTQAPLQWQTIPSPAGCGPVTATVTGLTRGTGYIFWLRAVTEDHVSGGTSDIWIARSIVFTAA